VTPKEVGAPVARANNGVKRRIAQPRVAEMVADELRGRIVRGDLADGDLLPKLDDLLEQFPVSRPSIREAMRILETEGLISVRRGKVGGAVVHSPTAEAAAYMVGLVMQAQALTLADLAQALAVLEPACARLVAERDDAATVAVPLLEAITSEAASHLDDGPTFTRLARGFHDQMVTLCPVRTLVLLVGVLEALWSAHEADWADRTQAEGSYPARQLREEVLRAHQQVIEAIRAGESDRTERLVRQHLRASQSFTLEMNGVRPLSIINARSGLKANKGLRITE
jgi:GntR family transcriptional regulator, transcriptional repressor for pyruvate dehydrogenase complex